MRIIGVVGVFCIMLAITTCSNSNAKLSKHSGRIISVTDGGEVKFTKLIEQLSKADYILLGEVHDNLRHHAFQNKILNALVGKGNKPAVVFEMFDREDSGAISSAYRKHPDDPNRIAKAVLWEESGWPDWSMYRPIVKTAMVAKLPIVAGNLSRKKAIKIVMKGQSMSQLMENKTAKQMGLLAPLKKFDEKVLRDKLARLHGGRIPLPMIPNMLTAQRVRDATLAESMIAHNRGEGAVLIAGKEHVRSDYGVPFYLRYREPDALTISVAFSSSPKSNDKNSFTQKYRAYDFVWEFLEDGSAEKKIAHQ